MHQFLFCIFIAFALLKFGECGIKVIADERFLDDCLYAHNKYRDYHENTQRLSLDRNATDYAVYRARSLAKIEGGHGGHGGHGVHGGHGGYERLAPPRRVIYGENFYWYYDSAGYHGCEDAVELWYKGINQYNYNRPAFSEKSGGFSQLVWRGSKYLGCARVEDDTRGYFETYIVCSYLPAGNVEGQYPYNVYPPKERPDRPGNIDRPDHRPSRRPPPPPSYPYNKQSDQIAE